MTTTDRMRFFQTSADIRITILAAKAVWEAKNPGRWFMKGEIVAASPGEAGGNRWAGGLTLVPRQHESSVHHSGD